MTRYVGTTTVAGWFTIDPSTVHHWRKRYDTTPEPDVYIENTPGWLPGRRAEWRKWYRTQGPGQHCESCQGSKGSLGSP